MDQTVVDVTERVAEGMDVKLGDEVVIFGRQRDTILPAAEQAAHVETISYELFCLAGRLNPRWPLTDDNG